MNLSLFRITFRSPGRRTGFPAWIWLPLAGALAAPGFAAAPPVDPGLRPSRIILNPTTEPATSVAVTWRTETEAREPAVEWALATPGPEFKASAATLAARTEAVAVAPGRRAYYHSAVLRGLKPSTAYLYRVGGAGAWSGWTAFTTAADRPAPFTFVYLGDPQDDLTEHVTRVFRAADQGAPRAAFWLIAGDLTSEPEDRQTHDLFEAAGPAFQGRPVLPVAGNHDLEFVYENGRIAINARGKKVRAKTLPPSWRAQFTLPENGVRGFEESCYHLDYQGLRVIVINSNDRLAEQAGWLERLLENNPNRWTIVAFHHPVYSTGRERDDRETRDAFLPVFDRHPVDLVLTGHDHSYARTHRLRRGARVGPGERGTVFVVSSSGPKFYAVNAQYDALMAKMAGQRQLYQTIDVDDARLTFPSVTANGETNDRFELAALPPVAP